MASTQEDYDEMRTLDKASNSFVDMKVELTVDLCIRLRVKSVSEISIILEVLKRVSKHAGFRGRNSEINYLLTHETILEAWKRPNFYQLELAKKKTRAKELQWYYDNNQTTSIESRPS